jgi:hypothetical protein
LRELFKLNILVAHFYETKKTDSSIGFTQFIIMHYLTDDLNDNDNDRDMQLPFKSPAPAKDFSNTSVYLPGQNNLSAIHFFVIYQSGFYSPVKDLCVLTDYQSLVWHPPDFS